MWRNLIYLVIQIFLLSNYVYGVYIPPGPKYKCPTIAQIWPCICISGKDEGISLQCEDVSLATLSAGLTYIIEKEIPIESLHIINLNSEVLYGSLFEGFNLTKLVIENSPIKSISSDAFYYIGDSLKDLQLIKTQLSEYSNEAFQELKNLVSLTIDEHYIEKLLEPFKGLDNLKALRISHGKLNEFSKITFTTLGKLNRLDLHGNQLKDILKDSLQQQKNLEFLDIAFNNFTKLDPNYFNHLTKLTWFNGSHNSIPEFKRGAFARNNFLRVIYLTHNSLTKLDSATFRGMRLLRRLYLSDNQISEVGRSTFDSINKVGTIDLSRNQLKIIDSKMFSALVQAEVLDISENEIREIKREAFHDLAYVLINMSYNQISKFEKNSFINCVNITLLDLRYNQIENFTRGTFDEFSYPTELRLDFNLLTSLGDVPFKNFHGLKILNVSNNNLIQIPKNTFPKLYELHTVDLSYNNISIIHPAIFTNLFTLRYLNLSFNSLTQLKASTFGTIPTLIDLTVKNNGIKSVSSFAFTQLASLRHLDASNNNITSVFQIPQSLSSLDLSTNEITSLAKAWPVMNSLLVLDLNGNKLGGNLDGGSFGNLGSLQEVKLAHNNIKEIPQSALSSLTIVQRIDLSNNEIESLNRGALGRLPVLLNLDLSFNQITSIEEKSFEGLLQLQEINLSNNNISNLIVGCFSSLVSLKIMNLSSNLIQRTDNGTQCIFEENLSLETLDLSHNKFITLTSLTFPSKEWTPYRLTSVNLSNNYISLLTKDLLVGTKRVKYLDLNSNRISEIRPSILGNLSSLEVLNLSNNSIGYIDLKILGPPSKLEELNLSRNKLRKFPLEILDKAPFTLLNLMNNNFINFDIEFLSKIQNGSRILFNQNPIVCDCRLIPLVRFFKDFRPKLSNYSIEFYNDFINFQCRLSHNLTTQLSSLSEENLKCDYKKDYLAPIIPLNYDLEIRNIIQKGSFIEMRWRVRSKDDITGFRLSMMQSININEKELWTRTYSYNIRSIKVRLVSGTKIICLWTITTKLEGIYTKGFKICENIDTNSISFEPRFIKSSSSIIPTFPSYLLLIFQILSTVIVIK